MKTVKRSLAEKEELLQEFIEKNGHLEKELATMIRENQRLRWRVQQCDLEVNAAHADVERSSEVAESLRFANQQLLLMSEMQCNMQRRINDAELEAVRLASWQELDACASPQDPVSRATHMHTVCRAKEEALQARCHLLEEAVTKAQNEATVAARRSKELCRDWRSRASTAESRADTAEFCVRALEQRVLELEAMTMTTEPLESILKECAKKSEWWQQYSTLERPKSQQSTLLATDI